jgi:cell division protein FtsI/penicillin-binding protein 2
MITTLFHNGQTVRPRLVTDILAEPPWKFVKSLAKKQIGLRTSTIAALKKMLHLVATHGTGKKVDRADLGVKTGTAQVGVDNKSYHRWIVGFMPYRRPRYTLCALVKGTSDDKDQRVTRIFRQVTDLLLER